MNSTLTRAASSGTESVRLATQRRALPGLPGQIIPGSDLNQVVIEQGCDIVLPNFHCTAGRGRNCRYSSQSSPLLAWRPISSWPPRPLFFDWLPSMWACRACAVDCRLWTAVILFVLWLRIRLHSETGELPCSHFGPFINQLNYLKIYKVEQVCYQREWEVSETSECGKRTTRARLSRNSSHTNVFNVTFCCRGPGSTNFHHNSWLFQMDSCFNS